MHQKFKDFEVTVASHDIKTKLETNKLAYEAALTTAYTGFRKEAAKAIDVEIEALRARIEELHETSVLLREGGEGELPDYVAGCHKPKDRTSEYDEMIEMFTIATEEEHVLTGTEFSALISGKFSWSDTWESSNSVYMTMAGS